MKRVLKKASMLALIAASAFMFLACGGGGAPEEVAEKYVKAMLNSDYGTMKKLATESNKASVEQEEAAFKEKGIPPEKKELFEKLKSYSTKAEAAKTSEDGKTSSVSVSLLDKDGKSDMAIRVSLENENGGWKVSKAKK